MSKIAPLLTVAIALVLLSVINGGEEDDQTFKAVSKWMIVIEKSGGSGGERHLYTRTAALESTGHLRIDAKSRVLFDGTLDEREVQHAWESARRAVRKFRLADDHRFAEDGSNIRLRISAGHRSIEIAWMGLMDDRQLDEDCRKLIEIIDSRIANDSKFIRRE